MTDISIKVNSIYKSYGKATRALDNVSMQVSKGEVLVVMGPSGSGKSTLIRTFNGLEDFEQGTIDILGIRLNSYQNEKRQRILIC